MIETSLVLLRHGQSSSNRARRFTGWRDVPLSDQGRAEATAAGRLLAQAGPPLEAAFCSRLQRAAETLRLALAAMGRADLPVTAHWRLNERHVGVLQGLTKAEAQERFGEATLRSWRHQLAPAPPALALDDPRHPRHDPLYADVDPAHLPAVESLADVLRRVEPLWRDQIAPRLTMGQGVLVAGHGLSLWAVCRLALARSGLELPSMVMPNANPLALRLGPSLQILSVAYLDPDRAAELPLPASLLAQPRDLSAA